MAKRQSTMLIFYKKAYRASAITTARKIVSELIAIAFLGSSSQYRVLKMSPIFSNPQDGRL